MVYEAAILVPPPLVRQKFAALWRELLAFHWSFWFRCRLWAGAKGGRKFFDAVFDLRLDVVASPTISFRGGFAAG
ncbi:MAG TPA: hypothetical protein VM282_01400 [Acidimicrobiales bacterium]|nr:hypothetical protein [Acidimicrobiales bacterium]